MFLARWTLGLGWQGAGGDLVEAGAPQREVEAGMKALWEEGELHEKWRQEDEEDGAGRVGRTWPTQPRRR